MWRSLCAPPSGAFTRFHPACELGATAPRKPQLSTGPGALLSPVPLQSDRFHARGCNKLRSTGHTAEMREGKAVFIVVCFASFHPGLGRGRARPQCPGSMSGSLTSPHGQHREAFLPHRTPQPPHAQPQCNRAGAPGMPGFVVLSGPLGWAGARVP